MSRPAPTIIPMAVNPSSDFDAVSAYKLIEARRKRLGYIGTSTRRLSYTDGGDDYDE